MAKRHGYESKPSQLGWATPIYVGKTDASALAECAFHYENFRNRFLGKMPMEMLMPPGYTSRESAKAIVAAKSAAHEKVDTARANELGMMTCGSANTVAEKLIGYMKEIGFGNLLTMLQFGTLPADLTRRNMERFAKQVMPRLRTAAKELYAS